MHRIDRQVVGDGGLRLKKDEAHDSKSKNQKREKKHKKVQKRNIGLDSYVEMAKKPRHLQIFSNEPNEM